MSLKYDKKKKFGLTLLKPVFTLAKVSVIMLVTTTPCSDTLALALATLGGTTEMGPFLFVVILPKVAKASTVGTVT